MYRYHNYNVQPFFVIAVPVEHTTPPVEQTTPTYRREMGDVTKFLSIGAAILIVILGAMIAIIVYISRKYAQIYKEIKVKKGTSLLILFILIKFVTFNYVFYGRSVMNLLTNCCGRECVHMLSYSY